MVNAMVNDPPEGVELLAFPSGKISGLRAY